MRLFGFLVSVRFWVATWIVILFIGLTPQPPAVELVIVVGFVAHSIWFVQHRLRAFATGRALARVEEAEFRLRRRRRASGDNSKQALDVPGPADPIHDRAPVGWSGDRAGGPT